MHLPKSSVSLFLLLATVGISSFAQPRGPHGGMQGHCPMCGRQWDGHNYYSPSIPDSLPRPQNTQWLQRFGDILARERLSRAQYQKDAQTYSLTMPYNMIIPQEENHIAWISDLYDAFGMQAPDSIPALRQTNSARDALQMGMSLEQNLIPDYEWLIAQSENNGARQILSDILYQTRIHYTMFQHALSMGGMMGTQWEGGWSNAQMGRGHMYWGWGGGTMIILWIVLIAAIVYWIVQSTQRNRNASQGQESALDILKKRYARGEISKEEFNERKKDVQ